MPSCKAKWALTSKAEKKNQVYTIHNSNWFETYPKTKYTSFSEYYYKTITYRKCIAVAIHRTTCRVREETWGRGNMGTTPIFIQPDGKIVVAGSGAMTSPLPATCHEWIWLFTGSLIYFSKWIFNDKRRSEVLNMRYGILIEQDEDGIFVAECASLPGCINSILCFYIYRPQELFLFYLILASGQYTAMANYISIEWTT